MKRYFLILIAVVLFCAGCTKTSDAIYDDAKKIAADYDSFGIDTAKQTIDGQNYSGELTLSGMNTIWVYEADGESNIEVSCLLSVAKGKAKLVYISPDGKTTTLFENTDNSTPSEMATTTLSVSKGVNRIKLVAAQEAKIVVELQIEQGKFQELGM